MHSWNGLFKFCVLPVLVFGASTVAADEMGVGKGGPHATPNEPVEASNSETAANSFWQELVAWFALEDAE